MSVGIYHLTRNMPDLENVKETHIAYYILYVTTATG